MADGGGSPSERQRKRAKEVEDLWRAFGIEANKAELMPEPSLASAELMPDAAGNLRLLQWNILANGLSDDGFLVDDVLRDRPATQRTSHEIACELRSCREAHADLDPDELKRELGALAEELRNERTAKNHDAVLNWTLRWAQMRKFVALGRPHIITMQEVDCMAELQADLAELGYSCGKPGMRHVPAHCCATWSGTLARGQVNKDAKAYLKHLHDVGVAFAPKTQSNARQFALKRGMPNADDDGVAIFWRNDALELQELDFLCLDDKKRNQGAVKVKLRRREDDATIVVISAHLSSGTTAKDEAIRVKELGEKSWRAEDVSRPDEPCCGRTGPSLGEWIEAAAAVGPTLLCLDANTRPDQRHASSATGGTVWQTLRSRLASVWDAYFDAQGHPAPQHSGAMPVTTNKMRGPLSSQPKKMGEHVFGVVDHIYFNSLFRMTRHVWGPLTFPNEEEALGELLPTPECPSDHTPVMVDMCLPLSRSKAVGARKAADVRDGGRSIRYGGKSGCCVTM